MKALATLLAILLSGSAMAEPQEVIVKNRFFQERIPVRVLNEVRLKESPSHPLSVAIIQDKTEFGFFGVQGGVAFDIGSGLEESPLFELDVSNTDYLVLNTIHVHGNAQPGDTIFLRVKLSFSSGITGTNESPRMLFKFKPDTEGFFSKTIAINAPVGRFLDVTFSRTGDIQSPVSGHLTLLGQLKGNP